MLPRLPICKAQAVARLLLVRLRFIMAQLVNSRACPRKLLLRKRAQFRLLQLPWFLCGETAAALIQGLAQKVLHVSIRINVRLSSITRRDVC